ncbi:hypothetical protein ACFOU2_17375 [Bacillus songklensis]|uniref:Spore coat protein n=1 Tax=Bacillus songklensis TaxID=1069116 RepID=A0ABV8B4M5_9BACI
MRLPVPVVSVSAPVIVAPVIVPPVVVPSVPVSPVIVPPVPKAAAPIPGLPFSAVQTYPYIYQQGYPFTQSDYGTVIYPGHGSYAYGTNVTYFPDMMFPM